jgi:hypothetical protein
VDLDDIQSGDGMDEASNKSDDHLDASRSVRLVPIVTSLFVLLRHLKGLSRVFQHGRVV